MATLDGKVFEFHHVFNAQDEQRTLKKPSHGVFFQRKVDVPNTRFVSAFREVKNPHQKHIP